MKAIIAVPATLALVYRAYSKKSLTNAGIVAATFTAIAHAIHPWNLPFVLLVVFFLSGTRATHVKQHVKAHLTMPASGPSASGGEGPRTHVQVLANSLPATVLILLHAYQLHQRKNALIDVYAGQAPPDGGVDSLGSLCFSWRGDLLVIGIVANYAAVAADTFSSELGILATSTPRLITSWNLRKVPRGTNGGVTLVGLGAGLLGSVIVVTTAMLFLPLCTSETTNPLQYGTAAANPAAAWSNADRRLLMQFLTLWGLLGSLLDSVLGGLFQQSVRDVRSGKIVEGDGGTRVLVLETPGESMLIPGNEDHVTTSGTPSERYDAHNRHRRPSFGDGRPSRMIENGWDLLDNNEVNLLMATTMSVSAMAVAGWYWGVPLQSIFHP